MRIAQLFLGDIARAFDHLKPVDAATEKAVARALGFLLHQDEELVEPPIPSPAATPSTTTAPDRQQVERPKPAERPKQEQFAHGGEWLKAERDPSYEQELPIEIRSADLLEPEEDASEAAMPMETLFKPRGVRGILIASLGVRSEADEIDIEALIDTIARCEVFREGRGDCPSRSVALKLSSSSPGPLETRVGMKLRQVSTFQMMPSGPGFRCHCRRPYSHRSGVPRLDCDWSRVA